MTDLRELAERLLQAALELEQTRHPFDAAWSNHLKDDAKGLLMLANTDRHLHAQAVLK